MLVHLAMLTEFEYPGERLSSDDSLGWLIDAFLVCETECWSRDCSLLQAVWRQCLRGGRYDMLLPCMSAQAFSPKQKEQWHYLCRQSHTVSPSITFKQLLVYPADVLLSFRKISSLGFTSVTGVKLCLSGMWSGIMLHWSSWVSIVCVLVHLYEAYTPAVYTRLDLIHFSFLLFWCYCVQQMSCAAVDYTVSYRIPLPLRLHVRCGN